MISIISSVTIIIIIIIIINILTISIVITIITIAVIIIAKFPPPERIANEGQTFDPHPHPGGFTKLPECPVTSLVVVLGFHWQWGWGSKGSP